MELKQVKIFTDGSCHTASKEGGWGYLLSYATEQTHYQKFVSGYEANTTNNRMELSAAVMALQALSQPCCVTITTDSQYLRKAFTDGWLTNWQRNGWRTASKQPVKNKDLWLTLLDLDKTHTITWRWTKGHAGHYENELVDQLALEARQTKRGHQEVRVLPL